MKVRVWFMEHYKLTPFDQRFLDTPYEWMEFMYARFMLTPAYELERDYLVRTKYEEKKNKDHFKAIEESKDILEDSGYSEEDQKLIMEALKNSYVENQK